MIHSQLTKSVSFIPFLILFLMCSIFITSCTDDGTGLGDNAETFTVDAGPDQTVDYGVEVFLLGTDNYNGNSTLEYEWLLINAPSTSLLDLTNNTSRNFSFTPDVLGEYEFEFIVRHSSDNIKSDAVKITVIKAPITITGSINEDTVWEDIYEDESDVDYRIQGCISVNAELTIQAGILALFEQDGCISVGANGSIIAVGSLDQPIIMTGSQKTSGFWKGLEIESSSPNNELKHVTIEYGGAGGFDGANLYSNLSINGGAIKVSNCQIINGSGHGIITRQKEDKLPSFENNTVSGNQYPILTSVLQYHYFDGTNDFSGNSNDYIDTYKNWFLEEDVTWKSLNVPYLLSTGNSTIESDLSIEKGARFVGQDNSGIVIKATGSISAVGAENEMIQFYGINGIEGDWKGINIESNSLKNELQFVEIAHGGQSSFDGAPLLNNIILNSNARAKITNCVIRNGAGYGLMLREEEVVLTEFENNIITNNERSIHCKINHFQFFNASSDLSGNTEDGIFSYQTGSNTTEDVTWHKTNVPYKISEWHKIDSHIMLEAGVEIVGLAGAGLQIKENGSFNAIGTLSDPIILRGDESVPGYWKGISIQSNSDLNVMDYCRISDGGTSGFDGAGYKVNVEVKSEFSGGRLKLMNSHISNSSGYGVVIRKDDTNFENVNNTFSDNQLDDIFYE